MTAVGTMVSMYELNPELSGTQPRVLVTGATGFLGGHVARLLRESGYDVIAMGRNTAKLRTLQLLGCTPLQASLDELTGQGPSVDMVVHAAALSSAWGKWPDFEAANVRGTEQVLDYCRQSQVKRMVHISSPSIYTRPEDQLNIPETQSPAEPLNNYIASKIMAEALIAADTSPVEKVVLRPRGLIGRGDPSLMPRLLAANNRFGIPLFRDGQNLVDVTCVENVAQSVQLALERPEANGQTYNITNGDPRTFRSLLDDFFTHMQIKPKYKDTKFLSAYLAARALEKTYTMFGGDTEPPATKYTICTLAFSQTLDISKAVQELNYAPRVSIEEGIASYAVTDKW